METAKSVERLVNMTVVLTEVKNGNGERKCGQFILELMNLIAPVLGWHFQYFGKAYRNEH